MSGIDAALTSDYDLQIDSNGDILTEDFFNTAILMSLFCERRASSSEMPRAERRRGWIGNESTPNFEIGSKLWLYEQARVTRTLLRGIQAAAIDGLQWLIDDGYAVNILATSELNNGYITLTVEIERPGSKVEKRFYELWNTTGT